MRGLTFQKRILLAFALLFTVVQVVTWVIARSAIVDNILDQSRAELASAEQVIRRNLGEQVANLTEAAKILSADFGFRSAISTDDQATVSSALDNLRVRINADRVLLLSLDGEILSDTFPRSEHNPLTLPPETPIMMEQSEIEEAASGVTLLNGRLCGFVVVPVLAPVPIAYIALAQNIDDETTIGLREQVGLNIHISFLYPAADEKNWLLAGSSLHADTRAALASLGTDTFKSTQTTPGSVTLAGEDFATLSAPLGGKYLPTDLGQSPVALFQFSLDQALEPYAPLFTGIPLLAAFALLITLALSTLIARSIAQPVQRLSEAAQRILGGDYEHKVQMPAAGGEFQQLGQTFNRMMDAISDREAHIAHQARHDTLTGLPNRVFMEEQLHNAIDTAADRDGAFTLLLLKVMNLEQITVTLGHDVAERFIWRVGERISSGYKQATHVARHASDTFSVLLIDTQAQPAETLALQLHRLTDDPLEVENIAIDVTAAVGAATFPDHGGSARVLLQRAEVALFAATRTASHTAVYSPDIDQHKSDHLSMMSELRAGLTNGDFRFVYQPKIDIATGRIKAVEALIRWIHPERGFMPPDDFIPLAEQTGNVRYVTDWALKEAAAQARKWLDEGLDIAVAVNLSARDLISEHFPATIAGLLKTHDLPRDKLVLEITESAVMEEPDAALKVLQDLHAMGLTLSIDDYGTGYSSMAYLKQLPVTEIKIDKSFVLELACNDEDAILVRSTIELGHNLGLKVTAEGIEDETSMDMLRQYGCDTAQGYFISKPIPPEDLVKFARTSRWGLGGGEP